MKEFPDDNFNYDENGRKLSKRVENTVEKGEIARYEQFLLFPQCFQEACFPGASKGVIVWLTRDRSYINAYVISTLHTLIHPMKNSGIFIRLFGLQILEVINASVKCTDHCSDVV